MKKGSRGESEQRGLPWRIEWPEAIRTERKDGKVLRLRLGKHKGKTGLSPRLRSG